MRIYSHHVTNSSTWFVIPSKVDWFRQTYCRSQIHSGKSSFEFMACRNLDSDDPSGSQLCFQAHLNQLGSMQYDAKDQQSVDRTLMYCNS
jgi:hypothetical protein